MLLIHLEMLIQSKVEKKNGKYFFILEKDFLKMMAFKH